VKIKAEQLETLIEKAEKEILDNLRKKAEGRFNDSIVSASKLEGVKKAIANGKIARAEFCSIDSAGEKCAEVVEKQVSAFVRGVRVDRNERASGKCVVCGKKASVVVYIAKAY
jgi:prolyl-tRNA synthetase